MGQQQGKQLGPPMPPPPMEGVASIPSIASKPQPVSKIKGLKSRHKDVSSWSGGTGQALGAGPPSVAVLGMFNELSNGKLKDYFIYSYLGNLYSEINNFN